MTALLTRVKSRLFIHSRLTSTHALDGGYASLQRGRSLDFEDLRAYEHGDDVRDIDWRATARHGDLLVKRSRATRMHTVLFAVDTGRAMAALAPDGQPKIVTAITAVGALGMLSTRHGDDVSVVYGDRAGIVRTPPRRSDGGLEHALRALQRAASPQAAASDRAGLLGAITRTVSRRMILVVVTDEAPISPDDERLLRRLQVQHDVLWLTVRDADPVAPSGDPRGRRDADSGWAVPAFLHGDPAVLAELARERAEGDRARAHLLERLEIDHAELAGESEAVAPLLSLLARRSHGRS
ncbi:DUF58 domain-containing protein [Microbacterium sp. gxy059]|uniref:DUF58 domain-containing protein n=1 Tax=Microbacterium sp. gxy059 TaxID=2957199 RepID=UPI003D99405A